MYKSKHIKAIVFVLLIAGMLQAGIMVYSGAESQINGRYSQETSEINAQSAALEVEIPKKEIDINKVVLKKEVEDAITNLDAANAARNITNYKTLLLELEIPLSFQTEIEDMYINGHKVQDVLVAYEYLYNDYGNIAELEVLIKQKESGKAWETIFKEYKKRTPEFIPGNFEAGKLEEIFKIPGITPDDVIIADRITQQSGMEFDELVAMRGQGLDWKTINEGLGIVNTSGELPRVAITNAQVKNYIKSTGLSEERVIEALVLAQKLDKDGKAVVDKVKAGNTEEDIIAQSLEEKYR